MTGYKITNLVGTPTDYSDKNNWAHLPKNTDKAVDTFFVYPTVYMTRPPVLRLLCRWKTRCSVQA